MVSSSLPKEIYSDIIKLEKVIGYAALKLTIYISPGDFHTRALHASPGQSRR
jgi:hypothetical protein